MSAPELPPAPVDGLLEILAGVRNGLLEVESMVDQIVTATNQTLDQLPGWLVGDARTALADLRRTSAETIAQIRAWLANAGDPIALELAAGGWDSEVAGPVSRLVDLGAAEREDLQASWTGDAAEAYLRVLPDQGRALQAVHEAAGEARMALIEFANAIRAFWAAIDVAVAAGLAGLVAAVGAALASPTGIGGVVLGIGAISGITTSVMQTFTGFQAFTAAATTHGGVLSARIKNEAGFGDALWPRSTTDPFVDASLSDGDDTDWHVR